MSNDWWKLHYMLRLFHSRSSVARPRYKGTVLEDIGINRPALITIVQFGRVNVHGLFTQITVTDQILGARGTAEEQRNAELLREMIKQLEALNATTREGVSRQGGGPALGAPTDEMGPVIIGGGT